MARSLMLQGTGSDVGKTVLVAGLCRVARRRGMRVLPFKPQNMSNNAAVAGPDADGLSGEIGRAQWLQALAAGVEPSVHMNPVLLKPQSESGSQIIVHGKLYGSATARDYQRLRGDLLDAVEHSFRKLASQADLVLVEGAGSPAEINLRAGDIANMGFARRAAIPVVLVGDIDRGGVIASIVGTHTVLDPNDRKQIVGYVINKFRGDISLFSDGLAAITRFTEWPSFGVLPYVPAVRQLPAEDSVALERLSRRAPGARVTIAVPVLPRIANFDDLDPLRSEPDVDLVFVQPGCQLPEDAALIVLAGSKSTISDLAALRANNWDRDLVAHVARGGQVIGICGGYQMLGRHIADPHGVEGENVSAQGLGLLEIDTVLAREKKVHNQSAECAESGVSMTGYEIHMGVSEGRDSARPMIWLDGKPDGAISADGLVRGCYLHGLFGSDSYRARLLQKLGAKGGETAFDQRVEDSLDQLAWAIEENLNVDALFDQAVPVNAGSD